MAAAPFDIAVPSLSRMSGIRHPSGELLFRSLAWACLGGLTVSAMLLAARSGRTAGSPPGRCSLRECSSRRDFARPWPHAPDRCDANRRIGGRCGRVSPVGNCVLLAAVITLPARRLARGVVALPLVAVTVLCCLSPARGHRKRWLRNGTTNELVALPERDFVLVVHRNA
jgi:hypothetical protein